MKAATKAYARLVRLSLGHPANVVVKGQQILWGLDTYTSGSEDVLGEENPLGLNNEEVDKLVDVSHQGVDGLARDLVVLPGAELRGDAVVEEGLPKDLGGDSGAESHPAELEAPSDYVEVAGGEDKGDDGHVGDTGGTYRELESLARHGPQRTGRGAILRGSFQERSDMKYEW